MLFQGQEFLADAWFADNIPLNWNRKVQYSGVYLFYRDLIRLRRNWFGTTRGLRGQNVNVFHVNSRDKVIAYHRWDRGGPGDDVIVVINLANKSYAEYGIGFPREGLWRVRLNSDWEGYGNGDYANTPGFDTVAGLGTWEATDGMPFYGRIGIGPYTAIIFSQGRCRGSWVSPEGSMRVQSAVLLAESSSTYATTSEHSHRLTCLALECWPSGFFRPYRG